MNLPVLLEFEVRASHHPCQACHPSNVQQSRRHSLGCMAPMHDPCQPCSHPCPVLHCMVRASGRTHCTFTYHAQPPVAQSAPLYPAAHVHVHDPVVPPGVPCVESHTIVPAVLPSPAVHGFAAHTNQFPHPRQACILRYAGQF